MTDTNRGDTYSRSVFDAIARDHLADFLNSREHPLRGGRNLESVRIEDDGVWVHQNFDGLSWTPLCDLEGPSAKNPRDNPALCGPASTGTASPSWSFRCCSGWIFNVVGSATIDRLLTVFAYGARRYGIRQFVIDSLMMTDVPEDGPGAFTKQKEAVQKIADFCKRTGSHVHLVAHPRKARDEAQAPGKMDVSGSSKITDAADNVFSIWSARKEESEPENDKPDALLELHKQRNGDTQHFRLWLYFNRAAQQFCTSSTRRAVPIVPFDGTPYTQREPT